MNFEVQYKDLKCPIAVNYLLSIMGGRFEPKDFETKFSEKSTSVFFYTLNACLPFYNAWKSYQNAKANEAELKVNLYGSEEVTEVKAIPQYIQIPYWLSQLSSGISSGLAAAALISGSELHYYKLYKMSNNFIPVTLILALANAVLTSNYDQYTFKNKETGAIISSEDIINSEVLEIDYLNPTLRSQYLEHLNLYGNH